MDKSKIYTWANEAVSQFIEGACDSFLIVAGGSTATQLPVTGKALISSVLIGGAIYVAAFLKKNPTPAHYNPPVTTTPAPTP